MGYMTAFLVPAEPSKTAIMDMDYEWGWFTVGDTVYVFGEAFIQKIRDNISAFSLTEYVE
ncbi:MAG: hypothetical protein J6P20_01650 [Oscillospiraceae bacterium]|nr:hypothetical protein [Oscillospiraceae bacterium]